MSNWHRRLVLLILLCIALFSPIMQLRHSVDTIDADHPMKLMIQHWSFQMPTFNLSSQQLQYTMRAPPSSPEWLASSSCSHSLDSVTHCLGRFWEPFPPHDSHQQCFKPPVNHTGPPVNHTDKSGLIAVVLVGAERPETFEAVATSLSKQTAFERMHIFVHVDKPNDKAKFEERDSVVSIAKKLLPGASLKQYLAHENIARITYWALEEVFMEHEYDRVVFLEGDQLISHNYVEAVDMMMSMAELFPNIGPVSGGFKDFSPLDTPIASTEKKGDGVVMKKDANCRFMMMDYSHVLETYTHNVWAWGLTRSKYTRMRETYHTGLSDTGMMKDDYRNRAWSRIHQWCKRTCPDFYRNEIYRWAGQDWLRACSMHKHGMHFKLVPTERLASYIGSSGTHMNEEDYKRKDFAPTSAENVTRNINDWPQSLCRDLCLMRAPKQLSMEKVNALWKKQQTVDRRQQTVNRRLAVKSAVSHAYNGYRKFCWGKDELKPVSKTCKDWLGGNCMTLIDSLSTLYLTGLDEEFKEATQFVATNFSFDEAKGQVSHFETVIRVLGGFLSAYDLSGEQVYLDKALELAERMKQVFNGKLGLPDTRVTYGKTKGSTGKTSNIAEAGTIQLEYFVLANRTGQREFEERAQKTMDFFFDHAGDCPFPGLYPISWNSISGVAIQKHVGMGGNSDSFYEYLMKVWVFGGKKYEKYREMYDLAISSLHDHLIRSGGKKLKYIDKSPAVHRTGHLECFVGGMLALGVASGADQKSIAKSKEMARDLTEGCYQAYHQTPTHVGPQEWTFKDDKLQVDHKAYQGRPEAVESIYYMWKTTKDDTWREKAWEIFEGIEKYTKVDTGGYASLVDVREESPKKHDEMNSFFIAETLKYLYLIFCDDDVLPLKGIDEEGKYEKYWVFNTEAHPLRVY